MAAARAEVVVVGAGIAGLSAAWVLSGGESGPDETSPVITIIEAGHEVGGKVAAISLDGAIVDAGPDGALARRTELAELMGELGMAGDIIPIATSGASVFARSRLRLLPAGLQLGVPTSWRALRRSKTISAPGLLRALIDVVAPRPASRGKLQDRSIGALVETKLGAEVVTTLVDPMLGGIAAGRVSEMSAAAIFPPLLDAAQQRGSLMGALRALSPAAANGADEEEPATPTPAFISAIGGMHSVVERLAVLLEQRGVRIVTGTSATALRRAGGSDPSWAIDSSTTTSRADGVVLAIPAAAAAELLRPHADEAAALLDQIDYASVAVVTFEIPGSEIELPEEGTGVLIPPGTRHAAGPIVGDRFMTTALTFLDRKWPQLKREGVIRMRAHVGRIDDDRWIGLDDEVLVERVILELGLVLERFGRPDAVAIQRWEEALPQYRVNHLMRVGGIESAVERLDALAVAGAAYRGVGVPACIASGRAAGERVLDELGRLGG